MPSRKLSRGRTRTREIRHCAILMWISYLTGVAPDDEPSHARSQPGIRSSVSRELCVAPASLCGDRSVEERAAELVAGARRRPSADVPTPFLLAFAWLAVEEGDHTLAAELASKAELYDASTHVGLTHLLARLEGWTEENWDQRRDHAIARYLGDDHERTGQAGFRGARRRGRTLGTQTPAHASRASDAPVASSTVTVTDDEWFEIARRNARSVQTTIGWIFWDPGAVARYTELGLPGPLGYIAGRAAPLAPAGPGAVTAAFGSISAVRHQHGVRGGRGAHDLRRRMERARRSRRRGAPRARTRDRGSTDRLRARPLGRGRAVAEHRADLLRRAPSHAASRRSAAFRMARGELPARVARRHALGSRRGRGTERRRSVGVAQRVARL